ncbi:DNA topoisomerase 2-like [Triticum aestivum]|uniref:DNA topoisomerase 2-like n=1 Tax=Triticum aestivum TaxID=4565 RepID=UPI001D00C3FC|nr:DNA topoisomerase 2-like [Triticum aestivum]
MGGDGSDLNGASREGNGATSVAAAKTDEAGLEFLPRISRGCTFKRNGNEQHAPFWILKLTSAQPKNSPEPEPERSSPMFYDHDLSPFLKPEADPERSTPPSMVDGLKPGQMKVLFSSFKKNLVKEIKVAHFIGDIVSKQSAYHDDHVEQAIAWVVMLIRMAQDFVGSNNIPLLEPRGQFGTRNSGGEDAAEALYIYTRLQPITRLIFPKDDDLLLNYLSKSGKSIEPSWYMPIIPMVLVNGSGIGTGSSSYVPNYNPRDIIANLKRLLNEEAVVPMDPWYKGFKGSLKKTSSKAAAATYTIAGVIEQVDDMKLKITELPIRCWTRDYREFLKSMCPSFLEEIRWRWNYENVEFDIFLSEQNMNIAKQEGLEKKFNLTTTIGTTNMHLFDSDGKIRKYDTPEDILTEFFKLRLEYYRRRKEVMLENIGKELLKPKNQVRFILAVISGDIVVSNRKRSELFLELKHKGYEPLPKRKNTAKEVDEENDYEYLLAMPIGTLTLEKVQELVARQKKLEDELESLGKATPEILWLRDLAALEKELDVLDAKEAEQETRRRLAKNSIGEKVCKAALKNPPKKTAALEKELDENFAGSNNEDFETKPAAQKKKRPNKASASMEDDEDEALELTDRLAVYNFDDSPPEHSAIKTETTEGQQEGKKGKNEPSKRGPANKATTPLTELSSENEDKKFTVEEVQVANKTGGRKPAAEKPKKTTNRKRAPAQSNSGDPSPEKKVRKMSDSFNKKSGLVPQTVASASTATEDAEAPLPSGSSAQPIAPRRSASLVSPFTFFQFHLVVTFDTVVNLKHRSSI